MSTIVIGAMFTPDEHKRLQKADRYMAEGRERIAKKKLRFVRLKTDGREIRRHTLLRAQSLPDRGIIVRKRKRKKLSLRQV